MRDNQVGTQVNTLVYLLLNIDARVVAVVSVLDGKTFFLVIVTGNGISRFVITTFRGKRITLRNRIAVNEIRPVCFVRPRRLVGIKSAEFRNGWVIRSEIVGARSEEHTSELQSRENL